MSLRGWVLALQVGLGLLLAGCAGNQYPATPPDPNNRNLNWAEKHYIKKMQYQQMNNDRLG
jgi:hypothetical protein